MRKKCGPITLEKLDASGHDVDEIAAIVAVAKERGASPLKISELLADGYTLKQVDEVYAVARRFKQAMPGVLAMYDEFRPQPGDLGAMIEKIFKGSQGIMDLHTAIDSVLDTSKRYEGNPWEAIANLTEDYREMRGIGTAYGPLELADGREL